MCFVLPDSYASYVAEPAVRTAVDNILGSRSLKVPDGLDWGQLPDFHAAVLAAHQVRCEYATALQGLWDAVWGKAIDEAGIGEDLTAWSITDTVGWYEVGFDAISLWQEKVFARAYKRRDSCIGLGVSLGLHGHEAQLTLLFENEAGKDLAAGLPLKDDWNPEQDETYGYGYWSRTGLAPIGDGEVPLERLKVAAAGALAAITG